MNRDKYCSLQNVVDTSMQGSNSAITNMQEWIKMSEYTSIHHISFLKKHSCHESPFKSKLIMAQISIFLNDTLALCGQYQ